MSDGKIAGVETELHGVFQVRQVTRGTALETLVGADLVRVEAGQASSMHRHNLAETVLFFTLGAGEVLLHADRQAVPVAVGDRVVIPAGTYHAVRTTTHAVEFLSVQSPPILDLSTGVLDLEPIEG